MANNQNYKTLVEKKTRETKELREYKPQTTTSNWRPNINPNNPPQESQNAKSDEKK